MRLLNLSTKNFQSYPELNLDLRSLGLTLISGPTGSGKSSILDAIFWTLYGVTGKDSNSDDIRSWQSTDPTVGVIEVDTPSATIEITRIRSNGKNDLFYTTGLKENVTRGKDLNDTQKKITDLLGVSAEEFLISSYLHQFSKSDTFFIAKAKDRRETVESIVDLSPAINLAEKSSEARKLTKASLTSAKLSLAKLEGREEELRNALMDVCRSSSNWAEARCLKEADLVSKRDNFNKDVRSQVNLMVSQLEELDKAVTSPAELKAANLQIRQQLEALESLKEERNSLKSKTMLHKSLLSSSVKEFDRLKSLPDTCLQCLGPVHNSNFMSRTGELEALISEHSDDIEHIKGRLEELTGIVDQIEPMLASALEKHRSTVSNNDRLVDRLESTRAKLLVLKNSNNHYQEQLDALESEINPFDTLVTKHESEVEAHVDSVSRASSHVLGLENRLIGLNWLYDKSFVLRGNLMSSAVEQLNITVNTYLERHFDAAIRVQMSLPDNDKIEVEVFNNGFSCPYKQLSGGERRMLALAFNIAVMRAAQNKSGVHFSCLMLDEAFAGLDNELKSKAFSLLQALEAEHETILVIDHEPEFKQMFNNTLEVVKVGDHSEVLSV